MTASLHEWFRGLTCDHLYKDCPSRVRAEATLREFGEWHQSNRGPLGVDPFGSDVCGMCVARYQRKTGRA